MLIYNKVILLPNLEALNDLLNNNDNISLYNCKCIYEDKIAIQHYVKKDMNIIRIWKTKSLFDYWYNDFHHCNKNFIGSLDYTIYDTYIKIDHLYINDGEDKNLYNNILYKYQVEYLLRCLINFVKTIAKKENKNKIILEVHRNLRLYHKYYYYEGFEVTNRKCINNPFWIETEINLSLL
jgi:hypothetical protein